MTAFIKLRDDIFWYNKETWNIFISECSSTFVTNIETLNYLYISSYLRRQTCNRLHQQNFLMFIVCYSKVFIFNRVTIHLYIKNQFFKGWLWPLPKLISWLRMLILPFCFYFKVTTNMSKWIRESLTVENTFTISQLVCLNVILVITFLFFLLIHILFYKKIVYKKMSLKTQKP